MKLRKTMFIGQNNGKYCLGITNGHQYSVNQEFENPFQVKQYLDILGITPYKELFNPPEEIERVLLSTELEISGKNPAPEVKKPKKRNAMQKFHKIKKYSRIKEITEQ